MQNVIQSTRRAFLAKAPFAAAAIAAPAVAIAAKETAQERVDRLAAELSDALAEFSDGDFSAHVYPANKPYGGVKLVWNYAKEPQAEKVKRMVRTLQFEMTKMPTMETVGGSAHEVTWGGDGHYLRLAPDNGDGKDLFIGFVPPLGLEALS